MELYKLYQAEKYSRKVISNEYGFITYRKFDDGSVYGHTIYIKPEERCKGKGKELERKLIEREDPTTIILDVEVDANNPEISLINMLLDGYKILRIDDNKTIVMYKEIRK